MPAPADAHLWTHVRRSVIPLGQPCPGRPRRPDPEREPSAIDLHGDTIHRAYLRVRDTISAARAAGRRDLVVVTGRSGSIRGEFPSWAALHPGVIAMDPMHGGGAYRLRLRPARA